MEESKVNHPPMRQILQHLASGKTELVSAPAPSCKAGHVLIQTSASLISTGTERMLVDFGRASLLSKARQQPEKVKQVFAKARTDGLMATVEAVRSKLGEPITLGYCNVGVVVESRAAGFKVGDRVASNGAHADLVCVPKNLVCKIPDGVSDEAAATTVVGSIGLQGMRLAAPMLGECFAVTGCGLIGLLTVQMLVAQGCRVLAIDLDSAKLALAASFGAEVCDISKGQDPVTYGMALSRGAGMDGVIITASSKSSDPVSQAARMCRKRGRIILVGVTGLELNRAEFYEKELSFQVSCSYGPGRYDSAYELGGQDYPIGFVRWTEQRNFEAVLDLLASGKVNVTPLITHRVAFAKAADAYEILAKDKKALGILLQYEKSEAAITPRTIALREPDAPRAGEAHASVSFVGAGNYASRVLIPAFKAAGAQLHTLVSAGGTSSVVHGRRGGFANASTDVDAALADATCTALVIATRHDTHASLAAKALTAGKHVFVEKPLAILPADVDLVEKAQRSSGKLLMVGFNRRFAPQVKTMKRLMAAVPEPKVITTMFNAGAIPKDHWTQDLATGGGRIIGEACHHIDLLRHLVGAPIVSVQARCLTQKSNTANTLDSAAIMLGFADGSLGTIHYLANGAATFPKERIEVFCAGRVLQLDNFLRLKCFGWPGFKHQNLWRQDKGQNACVAAFMTAIKQGSAAPIAMDEILEVARVTIEANELLIRQA